MIALPITIVRMTSASAYSLTNADTRVANRRINTRGLLNCPRNNPQAVARFRSFSVFGPIDFKRACASKVLSP